MDFVHVVWSLWLGCMIAAVISGVWLLVYI